jgi:hypothetical protein
MNISLKFMANLTLTPKTSAVTAQNPVSAWTMHRLSCEKQFRSALPNTGT